MNKDQQRIRSVAIIGAGAAGAVTAAALKAENYFDRIRVFERRETPGGTWIYDAPARNAHVHPGKLPPLTDPPLRIPDTLPQIAPPNQQERYEQTPIYDSLTTNVPDIAMCFSDVRFAYGPFAPHYVPRQYIESYFSLHKTDSLLVLNTTAEDLTKLPATKKGGLERWKLTLRKFDALRNVDVWWEEVFDAVVLANGHYSVPYVPHVEGLEEYMAKYPGRVWHSKSYRSPSLFANKRVLIIGNSASGHDLAAELVSTAQLPVYQSRRSKSRWDGDSPPPGIAWKPVVKEYRLDGDDDGGSLGGGGSILFEDGTVIRDVDAVIYCTGYQSSFPFWNAAGNGGRPLWDYDLGKLDGGGSYWHTFFGGHPTLGIVGLPRVLTFRSFEYQAVALARLFAGRNSVPLPSREEQDEWERERLERTTRQGRKFHDVRWEEGGGGETLEWLGGLFRIAGLGTLRGDGRVPPVLGDDVVWALEHVKKYPEPGDGKGKVDDLNNESGAGGAGAGGGRDRQEDEEGEKEEEDENGWLVVVHQKTPPPKDLLWFI